MTFENSQNIEPEVFFLDSSGVNLMSPTICHYRMGISGSVLQIVNAQKKKLSLVPNISGHLCNIFWLTTLRKKGITAKLDGMKLIRLVQKINKIQDYFWDIPEPVNPLRLWISAPNLNHFQTEEVEFYRREEKQFRLVIDQFCYLL